MGQYWYLVNLDKKEFVDPHRLGCGLKLREQLGTSPGTGGAMLVLCAAMPEPRGGGDFIMGDPPWDGRKETAKTRKAREMFAEVAKASIGRWAGDRVALVGDYAEDSDLSPHDHASEIFKKCQPTQHREHVTKLPKGYEKIHGQAWTEGAPGPNYGKYIIYVEDAPPEFTDVSDLVAATIQGQYDGVYLNGGWRRYKDEDLTAEDRKVQFENLKLAYEIVQKMKKDSSAA